MDALVPQRVLHFAARLGHHLQRLFRAPDWKPFATACEMTQDTIGRAMAIQASSVRLCDTLFARECHENCECACSDRGCTGINVMLRSMIRQDTNTETSSDEKAIFSKSMIHALIDTRSRSGSFHYDLLTFEGLVKAIIRLETFEALGIRHTCCHFPDDPSARPNWKRDPYDVAFMEIESYLQHSDVEEIQELQEEDADLIQRLEGILPGVVADLHASKLSLVEYFEGLWQERIDEVLEDIDRTDEATLDGFYRTGVGVTEWDGREFIDVVEVKSH